MNQIHAWDAPCPAPHLPPMQSGCTSLTWFGEQRFARFRMVAWTCHEHRETWYELCLAGGLAFIRRLSGDPMKPMVALTHPWRESEARAVWVALLSGRVR
jgi:hypothetical protein